MASYEVVFYNDDRFEEYWKQFLSTNNHTINYLFDYFEYYKSYCLNIIQNSSFVIVSNKISQAIAFIRGSAGDASERVFDAA